MAATAQDTAEHIIGAGALNYPWYAGVEMDGVDFVKGSRADWSVSVVPRDPDTGETSPSVKVDHRAIVKAMNKITKGEIPECDTDSIARKQCFKFKFDKTRDECDFDGPSADVVLQVAVFGDVLFG